MQKISTEQDGVFRDGVPGLTRGTKLNAAWFQAVQDEICNLLTQNGVPLDPSSNTQLKSLFKDTLDRVFKSSVSVQDPLHLGVETTIDPNSVSINGITLQYSELNGAIKLLISEIVELAKGLHVEGNIVVKGSATFENVVNAANLSVLLAVANNFTCNGNFAANGESYLRNVVCDIAGLKKALSVVDDVKQFDYDNERNSVDNSDFAKGSRLRVVVVSGQSQAPIRYVTLNAQPVSDRSVHVVNQALGEGGIVHVRNSSNVTLCVLAPGADRWFSVAAGSWSLDLYTIG